MIPRREGTEGLMPDVGLVLDPRFEEHDTGPHHVERPARLAHLRGVLEARGLARRCRKIPLARASDEALGRVHDLGYVRWVETSCADGVRMLDADTAVGRDSGEIARLAAGSTVALCREVARGTLRAGFAAVRPPGHHAERDRAMGFCLFNNVAVAAASLRAEEDVRRVLIVDWDVHHGNGTQHAFEEDPDVFYFSVHQFPLYPGTGGAREIGSGAGAGATLNCPIPPGAGDGEFLGALTDRLVPAADAFRPEFVIVSAGFDSHAADPLASLEVTTPAFAEATRLVRDIAERHAGGRIVSVLEGGYHLEALGECAAVHLAALL
jgi:acetoin utilization deacetylase AcuC-like enzyme